MTQIIDDVLREKVIAYLKDDEGVAEVLGSRIFPEVLPGNLTSFPAAAITRTFTDRKRSKTGLTGITDSRVAITTQSPRKKEAVAAANAIESAMEKLNDTRDMKGLEIKKTDLADQDDFYVQQIERHQIESEYLVTHQNEE